MQELSLYRSTVWAAGLIGAGVGLFFAWTIRPGFLLWPITEDSMFRNVPADASAGMQAVLFLGMGVIALLHFTMWVGGSAAWGAFTVAYIGSLVHDRRS